MQIDLDIALESAAIAADIVSRGFRQTTTHSLKSTAVDPVTEFDQAAETAIREFLADRVPDDAILGEEEGGAGWQTGRVWIIDPLDGTINFLHGVPHVAVSVALWVDGVPRVAVVRDVIGGEVFSAVAGRGARVDEESVRVSSTSDPVAALVATGFPYDRRERAGELATVLGKVLAEVQGIRRLGSAALDLCWVAAGRFDAYWEYQLQPWDTAAGQLIVAEAGGLVTDLAGSPYVPDAPGIVASNGRLHATLLEILSP
ncbi:MAG: inositol monophosphatase family protein [Acidimicrobiia bacterium]|nr:inositol monophosphatase family protein [Acidimicrobiia bacterium]